MKKIILFCLIIYIESFAQSGYNIELKKIFCDWNVAKAYTDSVETVIRDNNGNVIQPSNDFYYEYHAVTDNLQGTPVEDILGGLGENKCTLDNDYNFIQTWYVIVKDPTQQTILGTSNTVIFQMETDPLEAKQIIFQALKGNGSTEAGVHAEHWMYVVNLWNPNFTRWFTVNHDEVLRSSPGFLSNNNDKFNYWNSDEVDVLNHNHFYYEDDNTEDLIARYNTSYGGITIQYNMDGFAGDSIEFKDPWLVDYNAPPYGMRNQGMNAPLKKLPSPFNPSLGSQYKGVLLDQNPNFLPNLPNYSLSIPSTVYISQTGKNHNLYLQSWIANPSSGADFEEENPTEWGVVFKNDGVTITANIKATQLSDDQNAFINNSQRKIVRTPDYSNTLHMVYESMGHVWYESSTDNGQSWILMNGGDPLDNGGGKSPSIDFTIINEHIFTVIVFQENSGAPPNSSSIKAVVYKSPFGAFPFAYLETETIYSSIFYSYNTNPVISISSVGSTTIVWEVTGDGLYYRYAGINNDGLNLIGSNTKLSGTTSYSKNPAIAASKTAGSSEIAHLVWEENNAIKYFTFHSALPGTIKTISTGSYPISHNASVITLSDDIARFCWQGQYYPGSNSRLVFGASNNTRFWYFGSNVRTPQITATDDNTAYYVIWNEVSDNSTKFTDNSTLRDIYDLNTTGQAVQLSNGADRNYMYALVYNNQTQPYFFKTSPSIGSKYGLQKSALNEIIGRGGVVLKDSIGFFFMLDNISVDNQPVDFVEVSDTIEIDDIKELNKYLISQPFTLTDNSVFNYTVVYGITDSSSVDVIAEKNSVSYNLDLIEANNGNKLGNIAEVLFDKNNLPLFDRQVFELNPEGIGGSKAVQLKITAQNNFNGKYLLTESYTDIQPSDLPKTSTIRLSYKDFSAVKDYVLEQNNPNPFNPSTTIRYQLPQDGLVTLKIYDILGREVITLVDEFKTANRYEVNFSATGGASSLASGVYLYRLTVNDYVDVKKMLLLK